MATINDLIERLTETANKARGFYKGEAIPNPVYASLPTQYLNRF